MPVQYIFYNHFCMEVAVRGNVACFGFVFLNVHCFTFHIFTLVLFMKLKSFNKKKSCSTSRTLDRMFPDLLPESSL